MRPETQEIEQAKHEIKRLSKEIDLLKTRARETDTDTTVDYLAHMKKIDTAYNEALNGILRIQRWVAADSEDTIEHVKSALERLNSEIQKARTSFQ